MASDEIVNLSFHGVGAPPGPPREPGERDYWVGREEFLAILDELCGREDVRVSFDDGNLSDAEVALVDRGLFRPILRASVSREELRSDIAESLTSPGRHLVTTNLANDDGLAIDFSERVTSANARTTGPSSTSRGAWSRALGACSCAGIR